MQANPKHNGGVGGLVPIGLRHRLLELDSCTHSFHGTRELDQRAAAPEGVRGEQPLAGLGRPILCGPSRKSFLKDAAGDVPPAGRVWATAAAVTASVLMGAHIVRVHDVAAMAQVVRVADRILAVR